jgi:Protein of unknown function (DUF3307)
MDWVQIILVFWVSHMVGDFLLQTDWQASHKYGGLSGDARSRSALFSHVGIYTLCFVPALIWVGGEIGALAAAGLAAVIFLPHLVIDDGRLLHVYMRRVKRCSDPPPAGLTATVDQSLHLICLWATALLAVA